VSAYAVPPIKVAVRERVKSFLDIKASM